MKEGECDSFGCAPSCPANRFSTASTNNVYMNILVYLYCYFGAHSLELDNKAVSSMVKAKKDLYNEQQRYSPLNNSPHTIQF